MNDVNQLNNGYKLPFISTLTCGVNNFLDDSESVVEGLLEQALLLVQLELRGGWNISILYSHSI